MTLSILPRWLASPGPRVLNCQFSHTPLISSSPSGRRFGLRSFSGRTEVCAAYSHGVFTSDRLRHPILLDKRVLAQLFLYQAPPFVNMDVLVALDFPVSLCSLYGRIDLFCLSVSSTVSAKAGTELDIESLCHKKRYCCLF